MRTTTLPQGEQDSSGHNPWHGTCLNELIAIFLSQHSRSRSQIGARENSPISFWKTTGYLLRPYTCYPLVFPLSNLSFGIEATIINIAP